MPKDFAHKPRPKPKQSSQIPRWVWLFTCTAAIAFVGFLYYLSQVPSEGGGVEAVREQFNQVMIEAEKAEPQPRPAEPEQHETIADIKEKAESLKQAFEFYELLEKEVVPTVLPGAPDVAVAAPQQQVSQPTVPDAQSWIIQVASFSKVADADRVRAELILNGLPDTEIVSIAVDGKGTFHRVMVGPFDHRPSLNKAQDILAELNYQPLVKKQ